MIVLSTHAVERYRDRVKPALSVADARTELQVLLEGAGPPTERPPFAAGYGQGDAFVEVSDGICLVLVRHPDKLVAATCLVRCGLDPSRRARRKAIRRKKRRARELRRLRHTPRPMGER